MKYHLLHKHISVKYTVGKLDSRFTQSPRNASSAKEIPSLSRILVLKLKSFG